MDVTQKYGFNAFAWGMTGWNSFITENATELDAHLHTYVEVTLGEAVSAYTAMYVNVNGKAFKAKADGTRVPCVGVTIEGGGISDTVRVQRVGPITNPGWAFTEIGEVACLSATTKGVVTDSAPVNGRQVLGVVMSVTKVNLEIFSIALSSLLTTTSSTVSTTSSSTTTTSSTVSTTSSSTTTTAP